MKHNLSHFYISYAENKCAFNEKAPISLLKKTIEYSHDDDLLAQKARAILSKQVISNRSDTIDMIKSILEIIFSILLRIIRIAALVGIVALFLLFDSLKFSWRALIIIGLLIVIIVINKLNDEFCLW